MKKGFNKIWLIALVMLTALFGCQRRPLELIYRTSIRVIVKCIWAIDAYPEGIKPTGVTMYFFRDGEFYNSITTANVDSCEVQLEPGHYQLYMISQSPEEFWRMDFENMTSYDNAETVLIPSEATWARNTRAGDDQVVVENPEVMCAGVSEEFDITFEETEEYQYYYTNLQRLRAATKGTKSNTKAEEEHYYEERVEYYTIRIPVYPKNIVSQMWVTIYSGNADVLKSVRATNSGMARAFELTKDVTGSEEAIQIINQWTLTMDDEARRVGHIDGIITTFGLPNGEQPSPQRDSTLNVSALLIDNATVANYKFPVGDKIRKLDPNFGYRAMYRLIFGSIDEPAIIPPDVPPEGGASSGMEATVSEWEDGETVEIPM